MVEASVIVNTVDRPSDLRRCLSSVLNQSYHDFEVIVVNNGIGEETKALLEEFQVKFKEQNLGFKIVEDRTKKLSYLFNLGWKYAGEEVAYLAYLADDTEANVDWLGQAIKYLKEDQACAAISGPMLSTADPPGEMFYLRGLAKKNIFTRLFLRIYEYFVMEDKTMEPGHWPQSGAFTMGAAIPLPHIKEPIEIDLLTSGNMVVRREAMVAVGGFDENFYFNHADGDLFIRMKKPGYKLVFHPQVSVLHHMRFGPTRYPWILGRDTGFYYLKDVRPRSLRGWVGVLMNLLVFNSYFVFKTIRLRQLSYLRGISGFFHGIWDFFRLNTPEKRSLTKSILVWFSFLSLIYISLRKVGGFGMMAYGDTPPFPTKANAAFEAFLSPWFYQSPGIRMPEMAPVYTINWLVGLLVLVFGGDAVAAQKFFHFLPIPLALVVMYVSLRRITALKLPRFVGSFIYSSNLVMVGEMLGGSEDNLYTHALLPVLILLLYRFYRGELKPHFLLMFSLVSSFLFLLSDHFLLLLVPFLIVYYIALVSRRVLVGVMRFREKLLYPLVALILVAPLTLSYSIDYLNIALPFLNGAKIDPQTMRFLKGNVDDTYRHYIFTDILRIGGSYYQNLFNQTLVWARSGFILVLLSFSWFFFRGNRRGVRLYVGIISTVLALLTILLIDRVRGERLSFLFEAYPFLFRFRNPARLTRLLIFSYSIMTTLTFSGLWEWYRGLLDRGRKRLAVIVLGLMIFPIFVVFYHFQPFFSGDFTLREHRGLDLEIQPRYERLTEWLHAQEGGNGFFRVIFVPWNHEEGEMKFYWLFPEMYSVAINYGAYTQNSYFTNMVEIYQDLGAGRVAGVTDRLSRSGVRYLVLNTSSNEKGITRYSFDYQTPWLLGSAEEYRKTVERIDGISFLEEFDGFRIYENHSFNKETTDQELSGQPKTGKAYGLERYMLIILNLMILVPVILYILKYYLTSL